MSALFQALSGSPMNVTIGRDQALTGWQNQRPNVNGDWKLDEPDQRIAISTPRVLAAGAGNLRQSGAQCAAWSRDVERGHGGSAAASRSPGRQQIEVRVEAFNLFNRVRPGVTQQINGFGGVGLPNTMFTNTLFGRITTAADPRIMQFALKYHF